MAKRKNSLNIDFSAFAEYAEKLDKLGVNLKPVFGEAMENAAKKVEEDTRSALADANLPAGGIYSTGDTIASIVTDAKVDWHGSYGEISLGFDKSKPGAGGFLITGTPKMLPNRKLEDIYGRRKYESEIRKQIREDLDKAVKKYMGG